MRLGEPRARGGIGGVDDGPVREDELHALHGPVGVLRGAAAHPGRVVRGDAAHHAGADRRGIGAELPAERREREVHLGADDPRPEAIALAAVEHRQVAEPARDEDEHGVGDGLAGEARARGAERDRQPRARLRAGRPRPRRLERTWRTSFGTSR